MRHIILWVTLLTAVGCSSNEPSSRQVIEHFDGEQADYSIAREYANQHETYPFIEPISDKASDKVIAHRNLVYQRFGQRRLLLDIFQPKASVAPAPAVVLIHGGGWRTGSRSHQVPMAQALAEHGFVGIPVEYRLSREALYPAGIHDIQAAIRWVKKNSKRFNIDSNKIAVLGASSGAHMATLIGSIGYRCDFAGKAICNEVADSSVQAIINVDGVAELVSPEVRAFEDKPGKVSYAGLWLGGRYAEYPELWQEASPLGYVGEHTPPALFINSAQPRFHAGRDELIRILNQYHTYSEVHTLADSPHSFWLFHPWFDQTRDILINFLNTVFTSAPKNL